MSLISLKNACDKCNALVTLSERGNYITSGKCPMDGVDVYMKSGHTLENVYAVCDVNVVTEFDEMTMCLMDEDDKEIKINATDIIGVRSLGWYDNK